MTLAPTDPRHGTENGYSNLRCHCAECRRAHAEYYRAGPGRLRVNAYLDRREQKGFTRGGALRAPCRRCGGQKEPGCRHGWFCRGCQVIWHAESARQSEQRKQRRNARGERTAQIMGWFATGKVNAAQTAELVGVQQHIVERTLGLAVHEYGVKSWLAAALAWVSEHGVEVPDVDGTRLPERKPLGRPRKISPEQMRHLVALYRAGEPIKSLALDLNVHRATIERAIARAA